MFTSRLLRSGSVFFGMTLKDARDVNANLTVLTVACKHYRYHVTARLDLNSPLVLARWPIMALNYKANWDLFRRLPKLVHPHVRTERL